MTLRTIVIGAGLSGLTRAYALSRRGEDVLVLEASRREGGAVSTVARDGFLLELGPNTVRPTPRLWSLVRELGLESDALLADSRLPRYVELGGRLHPLPTSPFAFARSDLLSLAGKLRLLAEPFHSRGAAEESVAEFFTRRLGREAVERFVDPFVAGIWAGDADRLEMRSTFPTLAAFERDRGSILAGALFAQRARPRSADAPPPRGLLSFREGLSALPRALARVLGGRLLLDRRVEKVTRSSGGWSVETMAESFRAERVVVATDAGAAAGLLRAVDGGAADLLASIPFAPLAVLHLSWPRSAFAHPPQGFGHLVARQPGRLLLGAVWTSSLFPDRAPAGEFLFTAFAGGARDPGAVGAPDERLVEIAARELQTVFGPIGTPRTVRITRYARALPQYERGHAARMRELAAAEARLPGLTLLGNYRGGVAVGDVVANGLAA